MTSKTPTPGIRSTCPYCGVGCGVIATPSGEIVGDPDHPANFGRLCSKGAALGETLGAEGRLLHPSIDGRRASWDEALDRVAERFSATISEHGPDSVAFYVSGQCLTEDYYVANKLMKGFIGSGNIDTNSRLCMASSVAGHVRAFGEDIVPGNYEDLESADLVILVGSNLAWCHPVLFQRLAAARRERGTRTIVIDPRRTASCEAADLHLALRPGSDVALFNGLFLHLLDQGAADRDWMERHTDGLGEAIAVAREGGGLDSIARLTDLDPTEIAAFYDSFAETRRVVTIYSQGVNQSSAGTDKVNAIINCHLATGRIGRPGMGPFSVTGQPNAMGGREVGGLANQLAAHMSIGDAAARERVARFWGATNMTGTPGLKAVELFDAVASGRIRALWIMATNPAVSMPRAGTVRRALEDCPFVVVSEAFAGVDTATYADILLPAASWGEKDGTVTNSERRISRQRRFRDPPGEARPDWWMMAEVAGRMGWRDAFAYDGPAAIFREHAALSDCENDGSRIFDLGALADLSDQSYESLAPVQWPFRKGAEGGAARLFGGGDFATPDGRARFIATRWRAPVEEADADYPFVLNTGRIRDQWHTMTRTGRVPRLMTHSREPFLAVNPADAARAEIAEGGLVRIATRHGAMILRTRITTEQRPGEIFLPMHWSDWFGSAGPADALVGSAVDPLSGQPELKATAARLEAVTTAWHGILLRRELAPLSRDFYWSRIPLAEGVGFLLAGRTQLPTDAAALTVFASRIMGGSAEDAEASRIDYADAARGVYRCAILREGRVESCLFLTSGGGLPEITGLAELLQGPLAEDARLGLLLGGRRSAHADEGRIICACFSVGIKRLQDAVIAQGMSNVTEIGAALRAGTNCGSCIPELREILRESIEVVA